MRCRRPSQYGSTLKKASLWGAFFVSALVTAPLALAAECPLLPGGQEVEVRQVVDGDTLRLVDGRSVRLIGVNAPELGKSGGTAQPYAEAARRRLQALVDASDDRLRLVPGVEDADRFGRTLAHVYDRQGHNLEAQLIAEGLGYAVAIAPNTRLAACQAAAEGLARKARLGVWKQDPAIASTAIVEGGFAVVHGRLQDVERNRGGLWLQLDGDLVVRVPERFADAFEGVPLRQWIGRTVEARGWISDRSRGKEAGRARWQMTLSDPHMLGLRVESF
ncbi:thermonuclease family protein [Pseudomonas oryzihabitans]|uniref:Endonuclease YncB(Thermonuclease family) n=1 Tax=Pseudomonas oryzihabitans TaxID=47885 RepID=A0AAJ2BPB7_9PSED|nr:thermonuclease family protein [Pseudomonas psychrotolerans]MDR6233782.1 endonuclease YncB(thermonuclease family) [Pseudomonas psychrotolerans]MDR6357142.1 endonuclease YncB(thermonuclease family) [Pseudomonas psychrotolerans]